MLIKLIEIQKVLFFFKHKCSMVSPQPNPRGHKISAVDVWESENPEVTCVMGQTIVPNNE